MRKYYFILATVGIFVLTTSVFAAQGRAIIQGTTPDSKVSGTVVLTEANEGLTVETDIVGVPPGKHGFHFHENGSCADSGKAAGGHFNPDKVEHGYLPKAGHQHAHAGDMGNFEAGTDGKGASIVLLPGVTLKEGTYAVAGKAVILHEKEDDFSQPTGNAGARIGCGIIEVN